MASGASVEINAVKGGIGCCKTAIQELEYASAALRQHYHNAGSGGWSDKSYTALGAIVNECCNALGKPIVELQTCLTKLHILYRSLEEYEQVSLGDSFHGNESNRQSQNSSDSDVDWNTTMNTRQELQQIMEMEENGELDVSAIDLLSSNGTMSGRCLPTPITITLPANTRRYSLEDFAEQVLGQEDGLNSLTVYDFLTNYENRQNNGRDTNSSSAQQEYRQALVEVITEDIMSENPELSYEDARNDALSCVGVLAALHNPDQIVGGSGHGVTGAGRRNVNSALGSLWRHGRAQELYEQVREASSGWSEAEMRNTYLNVRLRVEDRFG